MYYECNLCYYKTTRKSDITRHNLSNKHKLNSKNVMSQNDNFSCKYCGKIFKYKSGMYRHQSHRCKIKKNNDEHEKKITESKSLKKQLNELITENAIGSELLRQYMNIFDYVIDCPKPIIDDVRDDNLLIDQ